MFRRRLVICSFCFSVSLAPAMSRLYSGDRKADYLEMRRLVGENRFQDAISRCRQLIETYPDYVYLYETLPEVSQYAGVLPNAVEYFEGRIEDGRELGLAYFGLGTTYYFMKDYSSAVLCLNKAVELGVSAPECFKTFEYAYEKLEGIDAAVRFFNLLCHRNPENANYRYASALAYWSKHDYQKVLDRINEAIVLVPGEQKFLEAKLVMLLMLRPAGAQEGIITRQVKVAESRADLEGSQFLKSYLALLQLHANRWNSLITAATGIFDEARHFGLYRWVGWASIRLALGWYYLGDFRNSLLLADEATKAARLVCDEELELAVLAWKVRCFVQLGEYGQAVQVGLNRIRKVVQWGHERDYIDALGDISWAYHELGENDIAMDCAVEASSRAEAIKADADLLHLTHNALGHLYEAGGHFNAAIRHYKVAQELVQNTSFPVGNSAASYALLGNVYLSIGDFKRATPYLCSRLRAIRNARLNCEEASALADLGRLYFVSKQYVLSRLFYKKGYLAARRFNQQAVKHACSRGLAEVEEVLAGPEKALGWYEELVKESRLAATRKLSASIGGTSSFSNTSSHRDFGRVLASLGRYEEAFEAIEEAKAQAVFNTLAFPWHLISDSLGDSLKSRLSQLKSQIERKYSALAEQESGGLASKDLGRCLSLRADLVDLEVDYWRLLADARDSAFESSRIHLFPYFSLTRIQREILAKDEAILEYSVNEKETDGFLVRKDDVVHFVVRRKDHELSDLMAKTSFALCPDSRPEFVWNATLAGFAPEYSQVLYNLLVSPVEKKLTGIKRLIIVPDGVLRYLPFESLVIPSSQRQPCDSSETQFLVGQFEVSYAAGAFLLGSKSGSMKKPQKLLLALGDPAKVGPSGNSAPRLKHVVDHMAYTSQLPGASKEVRQIAELVRGSADVLVGEEATEKLFRQKASEYKIVHLAAHAEYFDKNPILSKIQLAQGPEKVETGALHAFEFLNLDLNAELFVLSGCNTGRGRSPLGMDGLAGALFGAGVASVVSALWKVDDESTTELMRNFYLHLVNGERKSRALQLAKIEMIKSGKIDPFYWGAFVLVGDQSPICFVGAAKSQKGQLAPSIAVLFGAAVLLFEIRLGFLEKGVFRKILAKIQSSTQYGKGN